MSDDFDPDEWVESNTGFTYEHIETGRQIHFEAYEGRKHRSNIIESVVRTHISGDCKCLCDLPTVSYRARDGWTRDQPTLEEFGDEVTR